MWWTGTASGVGFQERIAFSPHFRNGAAAEAVCYPAGVGLLIRLLALLLILRLVFRFVAGVVRGYRGEDGPRTLPSTEMVRDRVCNTFLPRQRALRAVVGGREEHFCSAACRDRALRTA